MVATLAPTGDQDMCGERDPGRSGCPDRRPIPEENPVSDTASDLDLTAIERERTRIRDTHLKPTGQRPASTARGLHHTALISSDVERTVRFYQDVLGFPLTELIENRDYPGSSHFFFDIGNGNLIAFFDFPGLDVDRKSTRLNSSHANISYAVFCLKKKNNTITPTARYRT